MNNTPVLQVRDLTIFSRSQVLVGPISFDVHAGERVGLIGESGSGKSLTALAIMGLLPDNLEASGQIWLAGPAAVEPVETPRQILGQPDRAMAPIRGQVASMIFQEPMTALDPTMRIGKQVAEAYRLHGRAAPPVETPGRRSHLSKAQANALAVAALAEVGLPDAAAIARAYPHQLSGGQRQRVLIAMALANDPALLIADEPTTALDVTVQQQVLDLMTDLVSRRGTGLLFITHDLAVVSQVCERVLVLKDGQIVESGPVEQVLSDPQHPYTRALLAASTLKPRGTTSAQEYGYRVVEPVETPDAMFGDSGNPQSGNPAISVDHISKVYQRARAPLSRGPATEVVALDDVSLDIFAGERFGIVGESGSGKTTLLQIIAGLTTPTTGAVTVAGVPLTPATSPQELALVRSQLQVVFQDPMGSLDPRMSIGRIVAEPLLNPLNRAAVPEAATAAGRDALVAGALADVGLPPDSVTRYPHEFSGGQRQRISIARALVTRPRILLADEPVSALDVSVRAQILALLTRLAAERDLTLVLVSHDLAVIRHLCDRVAVLKSGQIVEIGPTEQVWTNPQAAYTRELQAATPML